ncbi:MAG: NAD-dependent epimerase/dehydratase family protein [Planctomycetota bacterium]
MTLTDWRSLHGQAFEGTRALVTGGAGFIGSHLTDALLDLGAEVVVLDDLSGGDTTNLAAARAAADARLTFVEASIVEGPELNDAVRGCKWVFHQAALGSVPRSIEMPEAFFEANVIGTFRVLEAARRAGVKRVVFAASSSAYGDSPTLPKIETMPVRAKSPYAATKAAGEAMLMAWAQSLGVDTASLRYFNIFGPRQNANSAYAAVIAAFAKSLLGGERPKIFGDGTQSRDFTFVDNAVHANLLAAAAEGPIGGSVMNVACGRRVTVTELAERMAAALGRPDLQPEYLPPRPGDVMHSLADLEATKSTLGYDPVVDFETGLDATVRWYADATAAAA